ncbi:hypothetical protein YC2023_024814 [Brassica napus]
MASTNHASVILAEEARETTQAFQALAVTHSTDASSAIRIASTNLHTERRAPSPAEEDEPFTICIEQIVKGGFINLLQCNHIYHHQGIIDWIRMNIRCHTYNFFLYMQSCRDAGMHGHQTYTTNTKSKQTSRNHKSG